MCFKRIKIILLHSLLEEVLRTDCKNAFPQGKVAAFWQGGRGEANIEKGTEGQETQSTVRLEGNLTFSTDPWWAVKATVGW